MTRGLVIEPGAETDLAEGYGWYESRQPRLGGRFIHELDASFLRILENPTSYQEVIPGIRRAVTRVFPYLVFFTTDEDAVYILAVLPAAQSPDLIASKLQH